jgi:2-oxoglutarate dehydrogenase E2 component (dihydrolipoamide succinyltransferase)
MAHQTDKITLEVSAPSSGVLKKIQVNEGSDVKVGGVLGVIDENKKNEEKILNNEKNLLDSEKKDLLNTKEKEIISKKKKKNIKKSNPKFTTHLEHF